MELYLSVFQKTFYLKTKKEVAELLHVNQNFISNWITRDSYGTFFEYILLSQGLDHFKLFVSNIPSDDASTEKIAQHLLKNFLNSEQATNFAKKLCIYSKISTRIAFEFCELIYKVEDNAEQSIRKQIVNHIINKFKKNQVSDFILINIRDFVDDLDDKTLQWIFDNKDVFKNIVDNEITAEGK